MSTPKRTFEEVVDAVTLISTEGREVKWSSLSFALQSPPATIRDTVSLAGIHGILELTEFASVVKAPSKVQNKLDMIEADDGNTVNVTSVSSKNKTIEDIVRECKIDLDMYEIISPKVRKWDVPIKQKDADGATHLEIVECYYIGFSLVLKSSIHIISPIVAHIKFQRPLATRNDIPDRKPAGFRLVERKRKSLVSEPARMWPLTSLVGAQRTVVLADPQIGYRKNHVTNELVPFHDRNALDVALQITRQVNPDTVVINGDWLDMSEWSDKFTREPGFFFTTQPALFETHYWLQKLRRMLPDARIVFIEGNACATQ